VVAVASFGDRVITRGTVVSVRERPNDDRGPVYIVDLGDGQTTIASPSRKARAEGCTFELGELVRVVIGTDGWARIDSNKPRARRRRIRP
jgi:hypothetical protein